MRSAFRKSPLLWGTIPVSLFLAAAAVFGPKFAGSLPEAIAGGIVSAHQTVLPARIEPKRQFNLLAESGGRVQAVQAVAGSAVTQGEILLTIENAEISSQATSAAKRLDIARLRLEAARSLTPSRRRNQAETERIAAAGRDRRAAQERLDGFSLDEMEGALAAARRRTSEIRALVGQGLGTGAELESAQAREESVARELKAAREHFSRLKQEADQTDLQFRLVQMQPGLPAPSAAIAEAELEVEAAQSALMLAEERSRRLSVTAPAPGTVIEVAVRPGDCITAGTPMVRLADFSGLLLSAPVTAIIARKVAPGRRLYVRLPTEPPVRVAAEVSSVTLVPDAAQQAYLIRVAVPNPDPRVVLAGLEAAIEFDHLESK